MAGEVNRIDRDAGHAEAIALVDQFLRICDGHDAAAVLAALTTFCAFSLDTEKIKRAKRARKEGSPT